MTLSLRIVLVVVSLVVLAFVTRKVRDSKIKIEDSLFWFCFAVILLLLSIFPQVLFVLSELVGTYSPANFVFLIFIAVLLGICFSLSVRVSQAETKIKELTQQLAIEKYERYSQGRQNKE